MYALFPSISPCAYLHAIVEPCKLGAVPNVISCHRALSPSQYLYNHKVCLLVSAMAARDQLHSFGIV